MDTFYLTDKGTRYLERLRDEDLIRRGKDTTQVEDTVVLYNIETVDSEVFKVLDKDWSRPVVRRLFEAGMIDKE